MASSIRPGDVSALLQALARAPDLALGEQWGRVLHPGLRLGRFELVRELGRGGFGVVWEARDTELGRPVAIKAVRTGDRAALREERLLREAEAAAGLSHPNIVTLHDVGRSEHGPYLVLELLRGRTLHERIAEGALPPPEAVRIAVEVAAGVAHAHEHGVVHRDLKPANVFVCDDGRVKVLDFGLAHALGQRRQDGGTPHYMAPEQWSGAPEDERTDVFALGIILYRLLSGELPFPEPRSGKEAAWAGPAPRLEVPGAQGLGELVARMLERDPLARPRDGGEVLRALAAVRAGLEQSTARPTPPTPVRIRRRLRRRVLAVLGAVALLAGTAGALIAWQRHARGGAGLQRLASAAGTSSLEAYQHHLRGLELRMRDCDFPAAEQEERQALALDPGFGAAHMQLGVLLLLNRKPVEDANAHFHAARGLADHMPDRERRLILLDRFITPTLPLGDARAHEPEALEGFAELLRRYPDDPYVLYLAGFGQAYFGHWDRTLELYRRSFEADPGQCYVASVLTNALNRNGRGPETVPVARRAVAARPNAANLSLLAISLARNGATGEALRPARESLVAPHGSLEASERITCVLATAGVPEEAEVVAAQAVGSEATEGRRLAARQQHAIVLGLQGRVRAAVEAWPGDDPSSHASLDARAALLSVGRSRQDARATLERLQEIRGLPLEAGELAFHGDLEGAERAARGLEPGSVAYEHHRAVALAQRGRWEEALPALRKLALRLGEKILGVPDARTEFQLEVRLLLGEGLLATGHAEEALEAMRSADEFGPCSPDGVANYPRIELLRGRALEQLGRREEAAAVLDRLLRRWRLADPGLPLVAEARVLRAGAAGEIAAPHVLPVTR